MTGDRKLTTTIFLGQLLLLLGLFFIQTCLGLKGAEGTSFSSSHGPYVHQGNLHDPHGYLISKAEVISAVRLSRLSYENEKGARRLAGEQLLEEGEEPDLEAPFGRHLSFSFNAFNKEYQVKLSLHDALFEEGAVIRGYDEEGNEVLSRPKAVAYQGRFPGGGWIRATIYSDDVIHAIWFENGQVNMIVPASMYTFKAPHIAKHAEDQGGQMFAFHLHDMPHDDHNRKLLDGWLGRKGWNKAEMQQTVHLDGKGMATHIEEREVKANGHSEEPTRNLQMAEVLKFAAVKAMWPYDVMKDCPSMIYKLSIGVAADAGYTKALTGFGSKDLGAQAAKDQVARDFQAQLNIVNLIYVEMVNVFISIAEFDIRTVDDTDKSWNQQPLNPDILEGGTRKTNGCPVSLGPDAKDDKDYLKFLSNFASWRAALPASRKHGLWHLMTNCFPPAGTVGLSYVGVTCSGTQGVGWSSYQAEATWLTIAHEIGHNFGAKDAKNMGGLMSYDGIAVKEYKFTGLNPAEICNHVTRIMGKCYGIMTSTCGNRILEPGEDCDDDSACCDNCKLKPNAMCSPGIDPGCCTPDCKFRPTTTGCDLPGGKDEGYCYNGICRLNGLAAVPRSTLHGCPAAASKPCKETVFVDGGKCGAIDITFDKKWVYNMPDGAFCDAALTKVCSNGECVAKAVTSSASTTATNSEIDTPTTPSPSKKPSGKPTSRPSKKPSAKATSRPTLVPKPTSKPTNKPTAKSRRMQYIQELPVADLVEYNADQHNGTRNVETKQEMVSSNDPVDQVPAVPSITVINPSLGESLYIGATVLIRFTSTITLASAHLELSDGTVIANNVDVGSMDGQYYWLINAAPGAYNVLVRGFQAGSSDPIEDWSDTFTIEKQYTLAITSPKNNQVVVQGEVTTIRWTSTGTINDVAIIIKPENPSVSPIDLGTQSNTGSFDWVPSGNIPQGRYKVIITYSPPSKDLVSVSSPFFRVRQPAKPGAVTLISPQTNENLEAGTNYTVMWTSPPNLDTVRLFLTQPGTSLSYLLYVGDDENSYSWQIDSSIPAGSGYQLLVVDSDSTGATPTLNVTSGDFQIFDPQPRIFITSIFTDQFGAIWIRGRTATIYFESSDPLDSITFQIQDHDGNVIYVIATDAPASTGVYALEVPYQAPPSDCLSCFLVAISNTYPENYYTYPEPFSITSNSFNDLASDYVEPTLTLDFPVQRTVFEPGKQYNIAWTGVQVSSVTILLSNSTDQSSTLLATVENTGSFYWDVPLSGVLGTYDISLLAVDQFLATPPITISIEYPVSEGEPSITVQDLSGSTISEGDSVTIHYTSEGVFQPLEIDLVSDSLGLIASLTTSASTSGSYTFICPTPPSEPITDAYLVLSAGTTTVNSTFLTIYMMQSLSKVVMPSNSLFKGETYKVSWQATGLPFAVNVMMYQGSIKRQTVTGDLCVPWMDTTGRNFTGCTLSYDLVNEVCATKVDEAGIWVSGGQCAPLSATFKLVLSLTSTATSTDGYAHLWLPTSNNKLPVPGTDYSLMISASSPGIKQSAQSDTFAIASPTVTLTFQILQPAYQSRSDLLEEKLLTFLSDVTGVSASRIHLNMTTLNLTTSSDANVIKTSATLESSSDPADVSAYDAGLAFVRAWRDTSSALYTTETSDFKIDSATKPSFMPRDDLKAEPGTPPPTPFTEPDGGADSINTNSAGLNDHTSDLSDDRSFVGRNGVGATIGLAFGCVGAAALMFLGVYAIRRHQAGGRSRATLKVQAAGPTENVYSN